MNRVFRLIWSAAAGMWVAVAETARGRGRSRCAGRTARLAAALVVASGGAALAGPQGGVVVGGTGTIAQSGTGTTIRQTSPRLAIDWSSFSTAADESVSFVQPGASAIALNRVTGTNPSTLLGRLTANGQVFVLNPNGVLFGAGSQVNVGGIVVSTLDLGPADFMAGSTRFSATGAAPAAVVNQGAVTAAPAGYVALLGPDVRNEGVITATLGTALLAAGNKVTLNLGGGGLLGYSVDAGAVRALADNRQLVQADGGQVVMTARAADALGSAVVNNTGVIEARTLQNRGGRILLLGDMARGEAGVGGRLDASAPQGGNGGSIETSAARVRVAPGASVTTAAPRGQAGQWLIDPTDTTIAAADPANGSSFMSNTALGAALNAGNVTIQTQAGGTGNGDIVVNGAVTWTSPNTLTLSAHRDVKVQASITAGSYAVGFGGGSIVLRADSAGTGVGTVTIGGAGAVATSGSARTDIYYNPVAYGAPANFAGVTGAYRAWMLVNNLNQLQAMENNHSGFYALGRDIDASATAGWNAGAGFLPIGGLKSPFVGSFDGQGHTISGLTINRPVEDYVGLFRLADSELLTRVHLAGASVTGGNVTGALAGQVSGASIADVTVDGRVAGRAQVGGLVGMYVGRGVRASSSSGSVAGDSQVGGLVGVMYGSVSDSHSTADVSGGPTSSHVGGLIGYRGFVGAIERSYATGRVSGASYVGGLAGFNIAYIGDSYATGSVAGRDYVGGLAGFIGLPGRISRSYASGAVTGAGSFVGGLVGFNSDASSISGYWNTQTSGVPVGVGNGGGGPTGLTTAQMQQSASFSGWDFGTTWLSYEGRTAPLLRGQLRPLTVTPQASKTFDGLAYSGGALAYSTPPDANLLGTPSYGGTAQGAVNPGRYTLTASGLYSNQDGYLITYQPGTLTINPAPIAVTASPPPVAPPPSQPPSQIPSQMLAAVQSPALVDAYQAALHTSAAPPAAALPSPPPVDFAATARRSRFLNVVNCGVLIPAGVRALACE